MLVRYIERYAGTGMFTGFLIPSYTGEQISISVSVARHIYPQVVQGVLGNYHGLVSLIRDLNLICCVLIYLFRLWHIRILKGLCFEYCLLLYIVLDYSGVSYQYNTLARRAATQ